MLDTTGDGNGCDYEWSKRHMILILWKRQDKKVITGGGDIVGAWYIDDD